MKLELVMKLPQGNHKLKVGMQAMSLLSNNDTDALRNSGGDPTNDDRGSDVIADLLWVASALESLSRIYFL